MESISVILTGLYGAVIASLAIYTFHLLWLSLTAERQQHPSTKPAIAEADLPPVTVQLPLYNEIYVATRVIDAVCALDYPPARLQIQVLDDSTDETTDLVAQRVAQWQQQGVNIVQIRRKTRQGFKAGALADGLRQATGAFVAIFDADFVPQPQWLRETLVPFFQPDGAEIGFVQTRWAHLNAEQSILTYTQHLILDDDAVQQANRAQRGLLIAFNGSAAIWRRTCIEVVGGWSGQTLSEDLDIAYRAQLAGWRGHYLELSQVSAEIPTQILAFKQQQFRWAIGTMQVARLLFFQLITSSLTRQQKVDALLFLTGNLIHGLLLLLLLLKLLLFGWSTWLVPYLDILLLVGLAGLILPSLVDWLRGQRVFAFDLLLQCGMALNNTYGLLAGLFFGSFGTEFQRTPKVSDQVATDTVEVSSDYALGFNWMTIGELIVAAIALLCCVLAVQQKQYFALPVLLIYFLGFGWVGGLSLREGMKNILKRPRV